MPANGRSSPTSTSQLCSTCWLCGGRSGGCRLDERTKEWERKGRIREKVKLAGYKGRREESIGVRDQKDWRIVLTKSARSECWPSD